jgi:hypothetical protein
LVLTERKAAVLSIKIKTAATVHIGYSGTVGEALGTAANVAVGTSIGNNNGQLSVAVPKTAVLVMLVPFP